MFKVLRWSMSREAVMMEKTLCTSSVQRTDVRRYTNTVFSLVDSFSYCLLIGQVPRYPAPSWHVTPMVRSMMIQRGWEDCASKQQTAPLMPRVIRVVRTTLWEWEWSVAAVLVMTTVSQPLYQEKDVTGAMETTLVDLSIGAGIEDGRWFKVTSW